jgi:hypothetical protein
MKTSHLITRFSRALTTISALIVAIGLPSTSPAQDVAARGQVRIGIYDSRSIAVAFSGSRVHEKQLQQLMTEQKKAKEAGEVDKVAQLEAEGKARQTKAHKQAFSTAPVDDLLLYITDALPEIRKGAGVTMIISKWDKAGLQQHAGAETVDVTMQLVDAFQPTPRQRKSAIEIQKHKPIPLAEAEKIKD